MFATVASAYSVQCEDAGIGCISQYGYAGESTWGYPVDRAGNNCTNYVAFRLAQNGAPNPGNLGNAGSWGANARAKGFAVDSTAAVGAVAWWDYGHPYSPEFGHVAYVEQVVGDQIILSDSAFEGGSKRWTVSRGERQYPTGFIHIRDVAQGASWPLLSRGFQIAFQSSAGQLWSVGSAESRNLGYGMRPGTSPSIAGLADGGHQIAFQGSNGALWSVGSAESRELPYGMRPGTSPSIAGLAGGGYQIAFQSSEGSLWTVGSAESRDLRLGMKAGTGPSITGLAGDGYQIAFQSSAGSLWTVGSAESRDLRLGMREGTSPAIGSGTGQGAELPSPSPPPPSSPAPTAPPSNPAPPPSLSSPPSPSPSSPPSPTVPATADVSAAESTQPSAAKLEIARARVMRSDRKLDVLAPITALASGNLEVEFRAASRTEAFEVEIDSENRRSRFRKGLRKSQADLGTGILTLRYPGNAETQPQEVRLRAASGKARLDAQRPVIEDGRLKAVGDISSRARGVVRLQLLYEPPGQSTRTLEFVTDIDNGEYAFDAKLPADVLDGIANRRGVVHSYTLFTGHYERRIRGEMRSYQVLGPR